MTLYTQWHGVMQQILLVSMHGVCVVSYDLMINVTGETIFNSAVLVLIGPH